MATTLIEYASGNYIVRYNNNEKTKSIEELKFPYKPTLDIIKEVILGIENTKIDNEILSGYVWNDMSVWLSSENQFNYKAAYDLAIQTNGANLPVTFKFGTTEEPKYHEFSTIEDLTDFYTGAMNHVNTTLKEGWEKKDSIDWTEYEKALENL